MQGGVYRKGMWPGVRPAKWETYAELEKTGQCRLRSCCGLG